MGSYQLFRRVKSFPRRVTHAQGVCLGWSTVWPVRPVSSQMKRTSSQTGSGQNDPASNRSVLLLRSAKAREIGELWREKCVHAPALDYPIKLVRTSSSFSTGQSGQMETDLRSLCSSGLCPGGTPQILGWGCAAGIPKAVCAYQAYKCESGRIHGALACFKFWPSLCDLLQCRNRCDIWLRGR